MLVPLLAADCSSVPPGYVFYRAMDYSGADLATPAELASALVNKLEVTTLAQLLAAACDQTGQGCTAFSTMSGGSPTWAT